MRNIARSTLVFFTIYLFLFYLLEVRVTSTKMENNYISGKHIIGATLDMTSRAGKEARVAMEIAVHDFNIKTQHNMTLYTTNSKGKVVQAIHDSKTPYHCYMLKSFFCLLYFVYHTLLPTFNQHEVECHITLFWLS